MSTAARVEVLHEGITDRFHYWQNLTGSVRLFRRRGDDHWVATVDGAIVTDADRDSEHVVSVASMRALRAPTVEALAELLCLEANLHVQLDPEEVWGRGDDALWLEPRVE